MDVKETGCRQRKAPHWGNCLAGDFGALTGLAIPCPGATILLHAWPHETLCDQLCCSFSARV
jgi:hypothetical protein